VGSFPNGIPIQIAGNVNSYPIDFALPLRVAVWFSCLGNSGTPGAGLALYVLNAVETGPGHFARAGGAIARNGQADLGGVSGLSYTQCQKLDYPGRSGFAHACAPFRLSWTIYGGAEGTYYGTAAVSDDPP
jgi:hypothetical protein